MTEKDLELEKIQEVIDKALAKSGEITIVAVSDGGCIAQAILTYIRQEEVKLLRRLIAKGSCYHGQSAIQMVNTIQQEIDRIKGE